MKKQVVHAAMAVVTATAVAVTGPAGTAVAAPPERGDFKDSFRHVIEDLCVVEGLTVLEEGSAVVRFQDRVSGKDGKPYYTEHLDVDYTITNQANGEHVRVTEKSVLKDLKVTDNRDGTSTILVLATGNFVVYDSAGKAIARNPGQTRFEVLIDNAGTLSDISDDEFLAFLGVVKESTGRSDDFCAAVVPALS